MNSKFDTITTYSTISDETSCFMPTFPGIYQLIKHRDVTVQFYLSAILH